jgi:hypothetical protein
VTPQETFVTRLRRHRERNGISLADIAAETRIKWELLAQFEQGDLHAWPRGVYARAWVRFYATAIGFDPIDTVDEFCRLFPHGDRRAAGTIAEIAAIVASPSEYRDEHPPEQGERRRTTGPRVNVLRPPTLRERVARVAQAVRSARVTPARVVRTLLRSTRMF